MSLPGSITAMISATARDLDDQRHAAEAACIAQEVFPIWMKHLPARDADGFKVSMEMVDKADIYIGIYAWRYGWVPDFDNPQQLSITELEFDHALALKEKGLLTEILVFIMDESQLVLPGNIEMGDVPQQKLRAFKDRASKGRIVGFFKTIDELQRLISESLADLKRRRIGDFPDVVQTDSDPIPAPPEFYAEPRYIVSQEFVGRELQLKELSNWAMPFDPHTILLFEAIGGNGKSMLTWEWTINHATKVRSDWAGRFWYSFYEKGAVMADFCQRALTYITGRPLRTFHGIKTPELAERLLHYLQERPWLLVLDGLERVLVAYNRIDAAEVLDEEVNKPTDKITHRDPCSAIRPEDDDLLQALASAAPSKLLISSRLVPRALLNKANQPIPSVLPLNLPGLFPPDAEKLLRSFGITGDSHGVQNYLETHCKCHPLVIGILAGLINDYLPDPGNFDAWAEDLTDGNQLNLANLDLIQKRNHILKAGLAALPEKSHELLSTLALVSESVDYQTLCAFNPHLPPEPEKVEEPVKPENQWGWTRMSNQEKEDAKKRYEIDLQRRTDYECAVKARIESPEFLAAPNKLEKTVKDLVRRGLLQYDGRVKRYDLHPVVRGVTSGGLQAAERDRFGQQVLDYFSHQSHNPFEKAEGIGDLRSGLEVVRTLLKMGRYEQAFHAFQYDLARGLIFTLEASPEVLSLLRPFFPNGWASVPRVVSSENADYLLTQVARALKRMGELEEAIATNVTAMTKIGLPQEIWWRVQIDLIEIMEVLCAQNRLAAAERTNQLALAIGNLDNDGDLVFREHLDRFELLARNGKWDEAEAMWRILDPMGRGWWRAINRSKLADHVYAEFHFWKGDLEEEHLIKAEGIAREDKNGTAIRLLHALRGRWQLEQGRWELAAVSLHEAVRMSRATGMPDTEAEAQLALAKLHLGQLADSNRTVEELSQARKPAHRALADLWLAIGNREQAKKHALEVYRWAWADGEPYVHRHELTKITDLLNELGVMTPNLAPYNLSKDKPFPWEADVCVAIEKLRAKKEPKKGEMPDSDVTRADDAANDRFSFGKVVQTTNLGLILLEYDFAADADKEFEYVVTPETEYGNVENLTDLQTGDDIVVDYIESKGKRVITTLVKEENE